MKKPKRKIESIEWAHTEEALSDEDIIETVRKSPVTRHVVIVQELARRFEILLLSEPRE